MIASKLFELKSFKNQYEALITLSVCETIPSLIWDESKESLLKKIDWNNILSIASILSYSDVNSHLDAALRISQTCLNQKNTTEIQKNASAIILSNLTNKPTIDLAIKRDLIALDYKSHFPLSFKLQSTEIEIENSIIIKNEILHLNKFQKQVHENFENFQTISISAPTSAGKSFILCNIIIEELIKKIRNIIYVVPTRALISQVEKDIKNLLEKHDLKNVSVSTVPHFEAEEGKSNVFVFTQERLHWFLNDNPLDIDLIIIDEAHKIDDGNRGILLQQKLEETIKLNKKIKVLFSSPFTSNPELLLENVKNNSLKKDVNTQYVSVNQNLIYASQFPRKPNIWNLTLCLVDSKIQLGHVKLKDRPDNDTKKITFISHSISNLESGNILYSNGAAGSEEKALVLFDLLDEVEVSENVIELQKLVKKTIHKNYTLAKVLKKGIAFHYGNMPLLIRQEIEKLFNSGEIKYLICTSTLLEGINLPAKSIFILKPRRGKSNPLNQNDFWNLAGRAGRLGKEFSGNIICINPNEWEIQPNPNKSKQKIERALDKIEKNSEELINYIQEDSPREMAEQRQDLEFAFGYYYIKFLESELLPDNEFHETLLSQFNILKKRIKIPDSIIKRNPGISPIAQQELYEYLTNNIERIDDLIPPYPEDEDAIEQYIRLIGRIGKTISKYPYQLNHYRSILLVNWMRGYPLSLLISNSNKYYSKKEGNKKSLAAIIRNVMDDVETFVRFRFAKDSGCYIDVLRYVLEINNKSDLIPNIPQLNLWLEFGVSKKTHLSLLSLGLSRNTVIELNNYITSTTLSKTECIDWLNQQDLGQLDLSPIIIEEIKKVLR